MNAEMKKRLQEIGRSFATRKAEIMLSIDDEKKQNQAIAALGKEEALAKEQFKTDIETMKGFLKEAKSLAKILNTKPGSALLAMIYLELKRVHWHLDQ